MTQICTHCKKEHSRKPTDYRGDLCSACFKFDTDEGDYSGYDGENDDDDSGDDE